MSKAPNLRAVDAKYMTDMGGQSMQGGDGGGGSMESRVAKLESDVSHIKADITDMKSDIRVSMSDISEIKKDVALISQKIDIHFDAQKKAASRIQWMVGIVIAAAALVPAYFGMVKSEPAPMQQPTIVYVQQPAPAVQATQPQVQPAPQPVPQEPTPEPQKAPATKQ